LRSQHSYSDGLDEILETPRWTGKHSSTLQVSLA
jgi:hypothetical protein